MRRNTDKAKNPVKNIRVSPICVYKIINVKTQFKLAVT
jgi:hypothetical protein